MDAIRFFRIYDIGQEVDIKSLEIALARSYYTVRANFQRIKPKSIMIEDPPLLLRMHPTEVTIHGIRYELFVSARIYDIGAISIHFVHEVSDDKQEKKLEDIGLTFVNDEIISDLFSSNLNTLKEILRSYIPDLTIDDSFYEDYFIYFTDDSENPVDPAVLLLGEKTRFSHQMREEVLKNTMSYTENDTTILSWGADSSQKP